MIGEDLHCSFDSVSFYALELYYPLFLLCLPLFSDCVCVCVCMCVCDIFYVCFPVADYIKYLKVITTHFG